MNGEADGGDLQDAARPDRARIQAALRAYETEFLVLVTPEGEVVASSEYNTLGYVDGERTGHHIAEHLHPDDLALVFDVIERARRTRGFEETIQARARHKDGTWRMFETTIIDASANEELRGAVLRARDITELHARAESGAGRSENRFLSLAEMLPLGILSADARGWVVFCNDATRQIFNLPSEHLIGHGWEKAVLADDLPDVADAAGKVMLTGSQQQVTFRIATGLYQRWAHAKFVPLDSPDGRTGWIATIEDITDRRRAEGQLAHQATHDALTALPNRLLLEDRLNQAVGRMKRDEASITLLFIDLDQFKEVNDTYGHKTGDEVLVEVAYRLRQVVRDVDTVARLGGDEFVAVCESLPDDEIEAIVGRIAEAIAVPMIIEGSRVSIGASVGAATTTELSVDVAELLSRADQAMYRDKQRRRDAS